MLGNIDGDLAIQIQNSYINLFFSHYLKNTHIGWLKDPIQPFKQVSGYFIGPKVIELPKIWPNAPCQN